MRFRVRALAVQSLLGGSWVVISGVISPLIWVISFVTLLITLLTTTHEPPSTSRGFNAWGGFLKFSVRRKSLQSVLRPWQTVDSGHDWAIVPGCLGFRL